ncbi:NUDIX domain-containing protein [Patescibacteria group bacterium]
MAAGAVMFDKDGNLLILHPAYKNRWEICGGIVEADESPRAACEREILKEVAQGSPEKAVTFVTAFSNALTP